jgi:hypothetical protein
VSKIIGALKKWAWFHHEVESVYSLCLWRRESDDRRGYLYCLCWGAVIRHRAQMQIREMRREERRELAAAGAKP